MTLGRRWACQRFANGDPPTWGWRHVDLSQATVATTRLRRSAADGDRVVVDLVPNTGIDCLAVQADAARVVAHLVDIGPLPNMTFDPSQRPD